MTPLTLGFSTCPNDTYIFHAIAAGLIDMQGMKFEIIMEDVEELNKKIIAQELDVSKASFYAFANHTQHYKLLNSGSAIGFGNGPLLVSKVRIYPDELSSVKIAIPGEHTTANLLLSILFPHAKQKFSYLFSDIEEAVLSNEMDAGLIIHENRFTYQKRGLKKIADLGELWENEKKSAIPLGGILVKRNLSAEIQRKVSHLIFHSITFARQNPDASRKYIKQHAKTLQDEVIQKHIGLYVNEFSLDLGDVGKKSIVTLFNEAKTHGVIGDYNNDLFID